jgi:hypothetical protein
MYTHRQIAKRKTILWQIAAASALGIAGLSIALPLVRNFLAPPKRPSPPVLGIQSDPPKPMYDKLNVQLAGLSFEHAMVFVPTPPPPPPDDSTQTTQTTAPPPPTSGEWAYLGSIITPTNRHALVRVDGQQQIYGVGSQHQSDTLVAIEPGFIEVETSGVKRRVDLTIRTLLTPNEPPKHPVAFRQPPNLSMGGAGSMSMALNQPFNAVRPPNAMDQARANAMAQQQLQAAAEAARREQAPVNPPGLIPMEKLDQGDRDLAMKSLSDPDLSDDERMKFLSTLGIGPGTSVEAAIGRMKEAGVDLNGEHFKRNMSVLESNAKNKP